jgi:adenosylcobinamide-phosphate synthase
MAGALHLRLAGNASYGGVLHEKPTIGDDLRPIEPEDILRCHKILYATSILLLLVALVVRGCIYAAL